MPGWRDIVAARTSHGSLKAIEARVRQAEQALKAAGHDAIEDAQQTLGDQGHRLRAWSADREGLDPSTAADLDRTRSQEMWAQRYGIPVEGSPVQAASPESIEAAEKALSEKLGYDIDLRNMPKPGTPEFVAKYCQPPEPIERIQPREGTEGFEVVRCDVDGVPIDAKVEPLETPGPGPARGTPEYDAYDHSPPKAT